MKAFVLAAVAAAVLAAIPASADPTAPPGPPTIQIPEHTFRVRLDKPHVVIDIRTPTAASAAAEAHESMRAWMMRQYEPATMHAPTH
ncbi:MAG TPA: hypothetical protein VGL81_07535 [Polyangiaceae bacterium]|jgi:hypothetical protein